MQILIIGAGSIGSSVAETLVNEANDITIVDVDEERISELQHKFDLRGIVGDAASPKVLTQAGANDADMIIAVTASDKTNMAVCLLASRLFNIPTRIARVRNSELRSYPRLLAEEGFQITSTIWPEEALTNTILRLIEFPEAMQIQDFAEGKASLFAVRAVAGSPLVGRPVSNLAVHLPKVPARIVAIFRRNRRLELDASTVVESGDEVIALAAGRDVRRVISEFRRHESPVRRIIIGGDHELTMQLAQALNGPDSRRSYDIKVIVDDATEIAEKPDKTLPVIGSMCDEETLENLNIDACDLFIALGPRDEDNIMGALLAKKKGARSVIALTNNKTYSDLMQGTQIDITVSMTQATIGELLRHVRRGDVVAAYSLRRGLAEALEVVAHGNAKSSRVVGRRLKDIPLPEGVSIAAIVRESNIDDEPRVMMASSGLTIEPEDHVILFVPNKRMIPQVEKLFTVDVGFF